MKIKIVPQNIEIEGNSQKSVLDICTENKIEIKSVCHGVPSCAECRVRVTSGEFNVLPPSKAELGLIGTSYYLDGRRLSCQLKAYGDITIDMTEQNERIESGAKKIRGAKTFVKSHEVKAVTSTLVLEKGPETPPKSNK